MYIFSQTKTNNPTPNLNTILKNINNIKKEVTNLTNPPNQTTLNKLINTLEHNIHQHNQHLNQLEQTLITATHTKLTQKQQTILKWLTTHQPTNTIYTSLITQLSKELEIPPSTVRWNLRGLRDHQLINAGTKENKGIPVTLTYMGKIIANHVKPPHKKQTHPHTAHNL